MTSLRANWVIQAIRFRGRRWYTGNNEFPAAHLPTSVPEPFTILVHEVEMDSTSKAILSESVAFRERPFDVELGCVRLTIPAAPASDAGYFALKHLCISSGGLSTGPFGIGCSISVPCYFGSFLLHITARLAEMPLARDMFFRPTVD